MLVDGCRALSLPYCCLVFRLHSLHLRVDKARAEATHNDCPKVTVSSRRVLCCCTTTNALTWAVDNRVACEPCRQQVASDW